MGITLPATLIPGNIIAPIKEELSIKDAAELIVERVTDSTITLHYFNNKAWCSLFVKVQDNVGMGGIN